MTSLQQTTYDVINKHKEHKAIDNFSPFYMLEQFSSGHNPMISLALWLKSYDHFAVVFLYEQVRPEHHRLHPYLHQQRGL